MTNRMEGDEKRVLNRSHGLTRMKPSVGFARNPRKSEPRIVTDEHG